MIFINTQNNLNKETLKILYSLKTNKSFNNIGWFGKGNGT